MILDFHTNKVVFAFALSILLIIGTISQVESFWHDDKSKEMETKYKKLQKEYDKLKKDHKKLKDDYYKIKSKANELANALKTSNNLITQLNKQMEQNVLEFELETQSFKLKNYLESYREGRKPITVIRDEKISWRISDSKGNVYNWDMPVETYENLVRYQPYKLMQIHNSITDEYYTAQDFTIFVGKSFTKVIDEIYDNSEDGYDFVYEIWYVVSQMTVYSYDTDEDPRWALETFTRGGGDCEDLAILIADMIKSSKYTKNWKIQLIYFDSDNPERPRTSNHVAIAIDDGRGIYFIEPTAKDTPYKWEKTINGWFFPV